MGRRAQKMRSSRRPGKAQRARVKKHRRGGAYVGCSAGIFEYRAGRKKLNRFARLIEAAQRIHSAGKPLTAKMLSLRPDGCTEDERGPMCL